MKFETTSNASEWYILHGNSTEIIELMSSIIFSFRPYETKPSNGYVAILSFEIQLYIIKSCNSQNVCIFLYHPLRN